MRILLLTHSFNSLTQRLFEELSVRGHALSVEFDIADSVTEEAVTMFRPDVVLRVAPVPGSATDKIGRHRTVVRAFQPQYACAPGQPVAFVRRRRQARQAVTGGKVLQRGGGNVGRGEQTVKHGNHQSGQRRIVGAGPLVRKPARKNHFMQNHGLALLRRVEYEWLRPLARGPAPSLPAPCGWP